MTPPSTEALTGAGQAPAPHNCRVSGESRPGLADGLATAATAAVVTSRPARSALKAVVRAARPLAAAALHGAISALRRGIR